MCVGLTYPADLVEHFLANTEVTLTPDLETCSVAQPVPGFNLLRNIYTEDCSRSYMLIKQVIRLGRDDQLAVKCNGPVICYLL